MNATVNSGIAQLLVVLALALGARSELQETRPCKEPKAAGFVDRDAVTWSGPWAFRVSAGMESPLPWAGERPHVNGVRPKSERTTIHFDDGRVGFLRVEVGQCKPGEACAPADWGSFSPSDDSQWLVATDTSGRVVFREHFWAPYGLVEVVPVDLVDRPGDEVLVIRTWAHASPSVGFALTIWEVGGVRPIDLSPRVLVAARIDFSETNWRADLTVDLTQRKPRTIGIRRTFGALGCQPVSSDDRAEVNRLGRTATLIFDADKRQYLVK